LKGSYDGYMANIILDKSLSGPVSFKEIDFNDVHATVNLENWQARRFLAEVTYTADSETQIAAYNVPAPARRDEPHEVFLPVPASKSKLTVTYALDPQFTDATTLTAAAGTTLVELLNLEPQQTYYYKVEDATRVITQGQVKTEGYLRQIKVPTVSNVRDMGGWLTAGGNRVRYGLVYRGGELNGDHLMYNGTALSEADRKELRRLGIAAELDLREDNDDSVKDVDAAGKSTALGNGAQYLYLNLNMWNAQALQLYSAKFKSAFEFIISHLRADRNVYYRPHGCHRLPAERPARCHRGSALQGLRAHFLLAGREPCQRHARWRWRETAVYQEP
ncbi:MAG: tyrosine-protein phosphatase, partial [Muribaculaceae bacterium]|nr:tyrosine-protein phosphatase [Muribaculaceae bacterium]